MKLQQDDNRGNGSFSPIEEVVVFAQYFLQLFYDIKKH